MRICFISFEYPPFVFGGAGVYAKRITKELTSFGHEIHVITPSFLEKTSLSEKNLFLHYLPIIHNRFLKAPSFWFRLANEYKEIRKSFGGFDILHSNSTSDFSLTRSQVKEPRVITVHHLAKLVARQVSPLQRLLDLSGETGLLPLIEKEIVTRADGIIAVSNFTQESLASVYGVNRAKITVIPNGVDATEYVFNEEETQGVKTSLKIGNHFSFLFVGRINDKRKGLSNLLQSFSILCKEKCKLVKLIVVGSGDQSFFKNLVNSYGISEQVIFTGFVNDYLLRKIYCASDAYVCPSSLEGFGLTVLEGMAAGKPIIAYDVGAINELVKNGENGILLKNHNPQSLAEAMSFFVDNVELARKLGDKNRKYVAERFSWKKVAEITDCLYRRLCCQ